jgi:hypothetical protein
VQTILFTCIFTIETAQKEHANFTQRSYGNGIMSGTTGETHTSSLHFGYCIRQFLLQEA